MGQKKNFEIGDALEFTENFNFAHRGCVNFTYAAGQTVIVGDECTAATITPRGAEAALEMKAAKEGDVGNAGNGEDFDLTTAGDFIDAIKACETAEALAALEEASGGAFEIAKAKWKTVREAYSAQLESFQA